MSGASALPALPLLAIGPGPVLGALAVALVLLAAIPSRARDAGRVTILFLLVLAPVLALGWALSHADRAEPLAWLALVPVTLAYLCVLDLLWGVSGRVTRGLPKGTPGKPAPKPGGRPDAAP